MTKYVTIYNPAGEPEQVTRANAVDLVRNVGYTWKPGLIVQPNQPIPVDITVEDDDNTQYSTPAEDDDETLSEREALEARAKDLGVEYRPNISTEKLRERVVSREKEVSEE